jgi:hypothetical protein
MSSALAKASLLKAEIRLAQAVSEFEADVTTEQKSIFCTLKSQSLSEVVVPGDVMRLTAEIDRWVSKKLSGQCFGPRFTNFLQGVQQFAALRELWLEVHKT